MIKKSKRKISAVTLLSKYIKLLMVMILLFSFVLLGFSVLGESGDPIPMEFGNDSKISLLGKSFVNITQLLGEPDEKGNSELFGAHQYILYRYDKGLVRFSSPESSENEVATSIILGQGQEVLGATIGMDFSQIIEILGTPDFGPEIGIDDLYYLDYFSEEINDQILGTYISFAALSMDSPTDYAFVSNCY